MRNHRTIGDLARETDVPISTVRYYERAGLVTPDRRTDMNYRVYEDGAVERMRFIRSAQAAGFTLADVKVLLELKDGNTTKCKEVRPVIEKRLAEVETRIEELKDIRHVLDSFIDICQHTDGDEPCSVMDQLEP